MENLTSRRKAAFDGTWNLSGSTGQTHLIGSLLRPIRARLRGSSDSAGFGLTTPPGILAALSLGQASPDRSESHKKQMMTASLAVDRATKQSSGRHENKAVGKHPAKM